MKKIATIVLAITLMAGLANAATPVTYDGSQDAYGDPDGTAGFNALDGTWSHENGSDEWEGTGPGVGMPGGAVSLPAGAPTYLRIQDTGDPRDYGMGDPSNRKVFLAHQIDFSLDGAQLEFGVRLSTGSPLDDEHPNGGGGTVPWPANGKGYEDSHNGGKGNIGIWDNALGVNISFVLNEQDQALLTDDVLFVGDNTNSFLVGDFTRFHDFDVDIAAGGVNGWLVSVSMDGGAATVFDIAGGNGSDYDENVVYMAMGSTNWSGAMDVDYIGAVPEPMTLTLLGLGGLGLIRRRRK